MKNMLKKSCFFGFLSFLLVLGFASVVSGAKVITIETNPLTEILHNLRLHSLFLSGTNGYSMLMSTGTISSGYLYVGSGLIVGSNHTVGSSLSGVMIGGGSGNSVTANGVGIAGGRSNTVGGQYGVVGGGLGNQVTAKGAGVAGGRFNEVNGEYGVVVGGSGNKANGENSVVLGGIGNTANGENSLVLGQNANGDDNSFAWSANAKQDEARIDADKGVLIGTYSPVTGVKLVVSGAVKLGMGGTGVGEINMDNDGCMRASDGANSYVLGRGSETQCSTNSGCQFGKIILQHGDSVTGYAVSYSENCTGKAVKLECGSGDLRDSSNHIHNDYYPYCYKISENPIR